MVWLQRNYFHDSYNNLGRFAASDFVYRNNTVERCGDGIHISCVALAASLAASALARSFLVAHGTFFSPELLLT